MQKIRSERQSTNVGRGIFAEITYVGYKSKRIKVPSSYTTSFPNLSPNSSGVISIVIFSASFASFVVFILNKSWK